MTESGLPVLTLPTRESPAYVYRGVRLPRVTWICDQLNTESLAHWQSKQAALAAVAPLWMSELWTQEVEDRLAALGFPNAAAGIVAFVEDRAQRSLSVVEAVAEAAAWPSHMREADRWRDFKGAVGTITHAYIGERMLGSQAKVAGQGAVDFGIRIADARAVVPPEAIDRHARYGTTYESALESLGHYARPYLAAADLWLDEARPDVLATGVETVVANLTDGYAGTMDMSVRVKRWSHDWPWPGPTADLVGDAKTSNTVSKTAKFQVAAYRGSEVALIETGRTATGEALVHELPVDPTDGGFVLHLAPYQFKIVAFSAEELDDAALGFAGLCAYARVLAGLKPARRRQAREPQRPRTEERPCPF